MGVLDSPCHRCNMRFLGCHSKCKDYKEYRDELARRSELKRKADDEYAFNIAIQMNIQRYYYRKSSKR